MKVAFFTFPSAFQDFGGGEIQLLKTKEYLEKEGVSVDLFDPWRSRLEDYDILHVFSSAKDCLSLAQVAKRRKVRVVNSPVFWSNWMRAFFTHGGLKEKSDHLLRHAVKVFWPSFPSARRQLLLTADLLLSSSQMEKDLLTRLFALPKERIEVVPNGVDIDFIHSDPSLFAHQYGKDPFVLNVARIEPKKNQLNLIRAVKKIPGIRLFLIGETVTGCERYHAQCLVEGRAFTTFISQLPHGGEMLKSAYAACSVFVLPSWHDIPGLVVLEAGLAGAKVVSTAGGSTREYFGDCADYINPADVNDIRAKILKNLPLPKNERFKDHILGNFTWDKVAKRQVLMYEKVLKN